MKKTILCFLFQCVAVFLWTPAHAQPTCEDGYGLCMANCATDRSPERCMQRCQDAAKRCTQSGVFRMPVGFLLNRKRLEDMSSAEGELPPGRKANRK